MRTSQTLCVRDRNGAAGVVLTAIYWLNARSSTICATDGTQRQLTARNVQHFLPDRMSEECSRKAEPRIARPFWWLSLSKLPKRKRPKLEEKMSFYFDNAATTFPKPGCVYESMDSFYREHGGNAGRGQYKLAAEATKMIFETRGFIKEILQCPNKDVIFAPSATIALNMVIQGILQRADFCSSKKTVYISPFEHNSVTRVLHYFEKSGKFR